MLKRALIDIDRWRWRVFTEDDFSALYIAESQWQYVRVMIMIMIIIDYDNDYKNDHQCFSELHIAESHWKSAILKTPGVPPREQDLDSDKLWHMMMFAIFPNPELEITEKYSIVLC